MSLSLRMFTDGSSIKGGDDISYVETDITSDSNSTEILLYDSNTKCEYEVDTIFEICILCDGSGWRQEEEDYCNCDAGDFLEQRDELQFQMMEDELDIDQDNPKTKSAIECEKYNQDENDAIEYWNETNADESEFDSYINKWEICDNNNIHFDGSGYDSES